MNNFEENTWNAAQCALDGQIALECDALDASRAKADADGVRLEDWIEATAEPAARLRHLVSAHHHPRRKAHWEAELKRIGVLTEPPSAPEPVDVPLESEPEPVEPLESEPEPVEPTESSEPEPVEPTESSEDSPTFDDPFTASTEVTPASDATVPEPAPTPTRRRRGGQ